MYVLSKMVCQWSHNQVIVVSIVFYSENTCKHKNFENHKHMTIAGFQRVLLGVFVAGLLTYFILMDNIKAAISASHFSGMLGLQHVYNRTYQGLSKNDTTSGASIVPYNDDDLTRSVDGVDKINEQEDFTLSLRDRHVQYTQTRPTGTESMRSTTAPVEGFSVEPYLGNKNTSKERYLGERKTSVEPYLGDSSVEPYLGDRNSSAELYLGDRNSSAELYLGDRNSSAELYLVDRNSSAELYLGDRNNSAELYLVDRNSSAELYLVDRNSSAELYLVDRNSSAELYLGDRNSSAELYLGDRNSSAELYIGDRNNSAELYLGDRNSSVELYLVDKNTGVEPYHGDKGIANIRQGHYRKNNNVSKTGTGVFGRQLKKFVAKETADVLLATPSGHLPSGFGRRRRVFAVDCAAIMNNSQPEIERAIRYDQYHPRRHRPQRIVSRELRNCTWLYSRGYWRHAVPREEQEFPLAFSILMHEYPDQAERLLRLIYRPHNFYCIHVDKESPLEVKKAIRFLANCFPNVAMATQTVAVHYAGYSRVQAELNCMSDALASSYPWRYYINLASEVFPLKSNFELVRILKVLNGSNDIEGKPAQTKRFSHSFVETSFIPLDTHKVKAPPPHNLTIVKNSAYGSFSRGFVHYLLHDPVAQDLLEWSRDTYSPDEHIWGTLHHLAINQQLHTPGGYTGNSPDSKVDGAHLGPTGHRWAPC